MCRQHQQMFKVAAHWHTKWGAEVMVVREEKSGEGWETMAAGPHMQVLDPGATTKVEQRLLAALARPICKISQGYEKVVRCVLLVRSPSPMC